MNLATILALYLVQLTGPDGQVIWLDNDKVITIRAPRKTEHFAPGTKCFISTSDGKNLYVTETCDEVRRLLKGEPK